jgi:uncharacterized membrane protein (UPF0127 family)
MKFCIRTLGALALAASAVVGSAPSAAVPASQQGPAGATIPLTVKTAKGTLRYKVEVATTEAQQARGLMYRTSLPDHGGMIFPMVPARPTSFWMKNTYIPLDIIFIRPNGSIARIAANAVPEDLTPIDSGEPVSGVLEIIGGGAKANGIAEGDKVSWKRR